MNKFILFSATLLVLLSGCSKQINEPITFENLYEQDDSLVLVSNNGSELSLGELKKQVFAKHAVLAINSYLENDLLMNKYEITEEFINQKLEKFDKDTFNIEEVRQFIILEEASNRIIISEEDLQNRFRKQFKPLGLSFEETKGAISNMMKFEKINKEKVQLLKDNEDIFYLNSEIKKSLMDSIEATHREIMNN